MSLNFSYEAAEPVRERIEAPDHRVTRNASGALTGQSPSLSLAKPRSPPFKYDSFASILIIACIEVCVNEGSYLAVGRSRLFLSPVSFLRLTFYKNHF